MTDLFSQPGTKRYQFFLDHVAESPLIWSLSDDGGIAVSETADGISCFSVWPSDYYAQQCAIEDWTDYKPEPIPERGKKTEIGIRCNFLNHLAESKPSPGVYRSGYIASD
jgi:hypothetical protein